MSEKRTSGKAISVGVIGAGGMVGTPLSNWFTQQGYVRGRDLFLYDINQGLGLLDDVNQAQLIFVAVPTPIRDGGGCDISIVESVVAEIADGKMIALKSTVPPRTTWNLQQEHDKKLFMFNPEFLTERWAWEDFIKPSRQIIGVTDRSVSIAIEVMNLLPQSHFCRPWNPVYGLRIEMNSTEAEYGKYASNLFGALKVAFANMLADLCWATNRITQLEGNGPSVDYERVREMIGADQRIGPAWLQVDHGSFAGFGGPCFPKDWSAFLVFAQEELERLRHLEEPCETEPSAAHAQRMIRLLKSDIEVLRAVWNNNQERVRAQGLTMDEVSGRDEDLISRKCQPIRRSE
jgi:nucleotide sugar dehydrogenase